MDTIDQDIRFLSLELPHRKAFSEEEQHAANYVLERLSGAVDMADLFYARGTAIFQKLNALYFAEFVVVGALAAWWPRLAFFYGLIVFGAYILELFGLPVFSRLLPQANAPVVLGSQESNAAVCTVVFTAYLDASYSPFFGIAFHSLARLKRLAALITMICILAACAMYAWTADTGMVNHVATGLRYLGMAIMALFSLTTLKNAFINEPTRGANHNASGVAAALHIAERLRKRPIEECNVLFLVLGGHYENALGMRAAMAQLRLARNTTYIINIEGVGAGNLHYTVAEGVLPVGICSDELLDSAARRQARYQARPIQAKHFVTNAYVPLCTGKKCISLIGIGDDNLPVNHCEELDTYMKVDGKNIKRAANFAEAIARATAKTAMNTFRDEVLYPMGIFVGNYKRR